MIAIGSTQISKVCLGSSELSKVCLGSTEIWGSQPSPLPYDAEIEYLQSSGTQYIDTGLQIKFNSGVVMEHRAHIAYNVTNVRQLNGSNGWGYWGITNGNKFECPGTTTSTSAGTVFHDVVFQYSKPTNNPYTIMYVDGTKIVDKGQSGTIADDDYDIFIFAIGGRDGAAAQLFSQAKIGSYQILFDGVLMRDYIAVRVGQTGYLYDKVSGTLFGNAGTGDFVLGPDKSPLPYDAEIEYLESTGTQWVDTGINLRNMMQAQMSFNTTALHSVNEALFGVWYDNVSVPQFMLWIRSTNKWGVSGSSISVSGVTNNANVSANTDYNVTISATASQASDATLYVFARNNDRNDYVPSTIKLYSLKITVDNSLVRDFIPVRVEQTGYLYDRVSGELFGNDGTGSFTLGPDKT